MNDKLFIGFDEELGGQVIKSNDGSCILFKDGDVFVKAKNKVYLNIPPVVIKSS